MISNIEICAPFIKREEGIGYLEEERAVGLRFLTVDVTPFSLKESQISPLCVTACEILPTEDGVVKELDYKKSNKKQLNLILNVETHEEEVTSVASVIASRNELSKIKTRSGFVVVLTGLSDVVCKLKMFLEKNGEDPIRLGRVDINRKFSLNTNPDDFFDEIAYKYLTFIVSRYGRFDPTVVDVHCDPTEREIQPYLILDRPPIGINKKAVYNFFRNCFPYNTVVWDICEEEYYKTGLDKSLTGALSSYGLFRVAAFECSGGIGVDPKTEIETTKILLGAISLMGIINNDDLSSYFSKNGEKQKQLTANDLISGQIRREWLPVPVEHGGLFKPYPNIITSRILRGGDGVGFIESTDYPPTRTKVYVPNKTKKCVVLGFPAVNIIPHEEINEGLHISMAIPE